MRLKDKLHLEIEPIGIFFGEMSAKCDLEASPERRNCVIPFLMAAGKGKVVSMNEESCTCAGGATGCCFGDGFTRINPNIQKLLSQGFGSHAPVGVPEEMKTGERFFCSEELALQWRNALPYSNKGYPRIVFAPLSKWNEIGTPDLVFIFANPDQISALVTMLGFRNGRSLNTIAPWGASCHSILYAAEQMEKDDPLAIMGLFDVSQRSKAIANYLSLTMPYQLWENLHYDLDKSCLTTHAWEKIEQRL